MLFNHTKLFQVHKDKTRFFQALETQREGQLHLAKKATNLASQNLNRTQVPGSPTPGNKCSHHKLKGKTRKTHYNQFIKTSKTKKKTQLTRRPVFLGGQSSLKAATPELFLETVPPPSPHWVIPLPGSPKPRSPKKYGIVKEQRQNNKRRWLMMFSSKVLKSFEEYSILAEEKSDFYSFLESSFVTFTSILQLHKNGKEKRFGGLFPFSALFICLFVYWGSFFEEFGYFEFPGEKNIFFTRQNVLPCVKAPIW